MSMLLTRRKIAELFKSSGFRERCPELTPHFYQYDQYLKDQRRKGRCSKCTDFPRSLSNLFVSAVSKSENIRNAVKEHFRSEQLELIVLQVGKKASTVIV